jgi:hypothetical protein
VPAEARELLEGVWGDSSQQATWPAQNCFVHGRTRLLATRFPKQHQSRQLQCKSDMRAHFFMEFAKTAGPFFSNGASR